MNFFNIGTAELMLIFVIALIVVGPHRLPEIGRTLSKILKDVRQISQEFTAPITQEMSLLSKGTRPEQSPFKAFLRKQSMELRVNG
jgi:sec-independent protein translocase protein TatA